MDKYILVSTKFEGYLVYEYNDAGYLVQFENCGWGMTEEQLAAVLNNLRYGLSHANFIEWVRNCGHQIIKVEVDLSFERFWREYDMARNKKPAEALWHKIKPSERRYVFANLAAYKRYMTRLGDWYNQKFPDTFLRTHTHDEWDKISVKPQNNKNGR